MTQKELLDFLSARHIERPELERLLDMSRQKLQHYFKNGIVNKNILPKIAEATKIPLHTLYNIGSSNLGHLAEVREDGTIQEPNQDYETDIRSKYISCLEEKNKIKDRIISLLEENRKLILLAAKSNKIDELPEIE